MRKIPEAVLAGEPTSEYDTGDLLHVDPSERLDMDDNPVEEENKDAFVDYTTGTTPGGSNILLCRVVDNFDTEEA